MRLSYHESGLLARLEASLPGGCSFTDIVAEAKCGGKGQRRSGRFGVTVPTSNIHEEKTFRIRRLS